jgi:hypothetical protein
MDFVINGVSSPAITVLLDWLIEEAGGYMEYSPSNGIWDT